MMKIPFVGLILVVAAAVLGEAGGASDFELTLRHRAKGDDASDKFVLEERRESWEPSETAVIVCDMWDAHHCLNATWRGAEMVPRINAVLGYARDHGALIIHAPSSCMDFYKDHPARVRAQEVPRAANLPEGIDQWMHWIDDEEEQAQYPIDHSDGGEDDDPEDHAAWAKALEERGRDPGSAWIRQAEGLTIDPERDAITDQGTETWNLLESKGIKNVILLGVHTNMCVLGRPFGLRQMAKNGKNVVLMRDMTDTMYNPKMPPYVSHFRGTDLVVAHVEKYVCPTITSDQLLGGAPFHFKKDSRKDAVFLIGEKEYKTKDTLPAFAESQLADDFRIHVIHADPSDKNRFPGIEALREADVLCLSVRRRALPVEQLEVVKIFVAEGNPVIGLRTASHAFSLKGAPPADGHATWERFDGAVLGGSYHGHHGSQVPTFAWVAESGREHAILEGVTRNEFPTGGSLYRVLPLAENAQILLMGRAGDLQPHQPVAWVRRTQSGSRVFCTSLGHVKDFQNGDFVRMLKNAFHWAVEMP